MKLFRILLITQQELSISHRREVISAIISEHLKHIFCYIAPKYKITLSEWNHDKDHVHVLFKAEPDSELTRL